MFDSDSLPFPAADIGYRAAVFKYMKYVHLIDQIHLFCLLNVESSLEYRQIFHCGTSKLFAYNYSIRDLI